MTMKYSDPKTPYGHAEINSRTAQVNGMTKREKFTQAALQGLCANPDWSRDDARDIAAEARLRADAALLVLEQQPFNPGR